MGHLEIAEKKKKGPQDYMENNVLTLCVTYRWIEGITKRYKNSTVIVR